MQWHSWVYSKLTTWLHAEKVRAFLSSPSCRAMRDTAREGINVQSCARIQILLLAGLFFFFIRRFCVESAASRYNFLSILWDGCALFKLGAEHYIESQISAKKTWAREKVEKLYLDTDFNNIASGCLKECERPGRPGLFFSCHLRTVLLICASTNVQCADLTLASLKCRPGP